MKKLLKNRLLIPVFAVVIFLSTTAYKTEFFEISKQLEIFTTLFKELNMNYVDETNPGDLMDTAIKKMLSDLDPYTTFLNEQDVEAARINNTGDYTGIGAKIQMKKGKLIVVEPYKDYPADRAGLKAGDEIVRIGNVEVEDFKDNVSDLIKGSAGSTVEVEYLRQGKSNVTKIKREEVQIKAVPHFSMIDNNIGYIVLSKFNSKASAQTSAALRELKAEGAKKIILDLRGNPGGLLREAVNVTNLFIPKGQLVVTTKSKVSKYNKTYYTNRDPIDLEIPLVVLINGRSASASEIVSGALQDLDRAVVIGARSFGKGLVQRPKQLSFGTQIKITISRYYTPSGRCIQSLDYWNRDEEGKAVKIKKYNEFKTKNGRSVFDGGGISPDVELDITKNSAITKAILNENYVFDYATQYYYNNNELDVNNFEFNDSDFKSFKAFLKKKNFSFETKTEEALSNAFKTAEEENLNASIESDFNKLMNSLDAYKSKVIDDQKIQLSSLLTDEIVKRYVYREGLYDYYTEYNPEIKKASEILNNQQTYYGYLK